MKLRLGQVTYDTAYRMFRRFYPDTDTEARQFAQEATRGSRPSIKDKEIC